MSLRLKSIVILGGGTAGWMAAAALATRLKRRVAITLVESDAIGTVGVGEATIPTIHWFNELIGLNEAEFLAETRATLKMGIEFVGWTRPGHRYVHPFGRYGAPMDGVPFHHLWRRANPDGGIEDFSAYSLATMAAMQGRAGVPVADPRSILSTLGYAYHFDASLYAAYLRRIAEGRGAARVEGKVASVQRDGESGFVTSLTLETGEQVAGDVFLDCSGLRALLIGETMGEPFEDWSAWLPCDRAWAVPTANAGPPAPFTRSTARPAGWQWRIPLQHRTGNGHVFASAFTGEEEARALLLANLEGQALADPRLIRFATGKRRRLWAGNVVAIGLASGFLEPLESTSIHLIQSGIAKFLSLLPDRDCDPGLARQFNRLFDADMENIRDFLALHYHAQDGREDPLWAYCRHMPLPDSLGERIARFRRSGRVMVEPQELFQEASWLAVLMGQGIMPGDYSPWADGIAAEALRAHLAHLRKVIGEAAAGLPTHEQALARLMRVPSPA